MLRWVVVRENIERGTKGGMSRENGELQKLAMVLKSMLKLVLY